MDLYRGAALRNKRGLANVPHAGGGSQLTKHDCERLFRELIIRRVLEEDVHVNERHGGFVAKLRVSAVFVVCTLIRET